MSTVIEVTDVSKAYQLGQINTGTLSTDLHRWWALKRGKEDPFLRIGETNDRTTASEGNVVWSLKDINFNIHEGDSVGIIGRNGAGKSTLLKLMSRITEPTTGKIKIKGKIASLLEVGTGFHPELSGRDNIFLNGAILGMKKAEIKQKFDEIVDFSGVERYIDTPVKRYSSGMYVRLAFAVAAHLDSEILIVDEVLAVGDAEFQNKCLSKMNELGHKSGRTIIFVSHNMTAIKALCTTSLYLNKGNMISYDSTSQIIQEYLTSSSPVISSDGIIPSDSSLHGTGDARFVKILTINQNKTFEKNFHFGDKILLEIEIDVFKELLDVILGVHILTVYGEKLAMIIPDQNYKPSSFSEGRHRMTIGLNDRLMPGEYSFSLTISYLYTGQDIDVVENVSNITISKDSVDTNLQYPWPTVHGYFQPNADWEISKL
ncbi:MAG: ABC transporter ATP-binding protein [Bacteroidetes bacterium]|nr:ABC transporter ATP-binding protein [Bacteroidota bacterium]MBU1371225.1 ABC transporter ATP-binding protein [Bacteroidota bacterium]MBU1483802.1 ABC transporter ATP-binding protein [Bacteroidota bacterium]MBU1760048.1 ABC transporter ATP-binding protein [Bacteroidota bacterium]MBU2266764.1 ABC transporter ATP-binding protein [Bacteroidota bacterium]